jgi:hypothetical protein
VAYLDSISASVPEFGGYFLDGQRNLVVYVTDTTKFAKARLIIAAEITHHKIRDKAGEYRPTIVLRRADFNFGQLQGWADALSDNVTGSVAGVVSSGVDIKTNRVRIGVTPSQQESATLAVTQSLATLGIPPAAITFENEQIQVSGPASDLLHATFLWRRAHAVARDLDRELRETLLLTTTLSSQPFNPWMGGVQLDGTKGCTGTLMVDFTPSGGTTHRYLMLASHCTKEWAKVSSPPDTSYYAGGVPIFATESYDPPEPRHSDMALFLANSSAVAPRGSIARAFLDAGNTNIDASGPPLTVVWTINSEVVGNYVTKVGAATGWTGGTISAINQTKVGTDGRTRYGQSVAGFADAEGDSGGPVFWPESSDAVDFEGIAWGTVGGSGVYSPLSGIYADLGVSASQFNFLTSITVSQPSLSGSVTYSSSCGHTVPVLTWTSSSVSGTSWPVSYQIWGEDFYGDGTSSGQYLVATVAAGTTTYQPCNWISTYLGIGTPPGPGEEYTSYFIKAIDSGVMAYSLLAYFQ